MIANVCLGITRQCSCLNNKTGWGGGLLTNRYLPSSARLAFPLSLPLLAFKNLF